MIIDYKVYSAVYWYIAMLFCKFTGKGSVLWNNSSKAKSIKPGYCIRITPVLYVVVKMYILCTCMYLHTGYKYSVYAVKLDMFHQVSSSCMVHSILVAKNVYKCSKSY